MAETVVAVLPVFLVILLGFGLKRSGWVPDAFWGPAEHLTYTVTFPALLTANLARADMGTVAWAPFMSIQALAVLAVAGLTLALRRPLLTGRMGVDDAGFTSVFQGAIRPNTYIGLAVAAALFGDLGVTLTAIGVAVVVPLVNVLSVACMTRFGRGQAASLFGVARGIVTNPLILACALGLVLNASGVGLPPVIGPVLEILGRAALPVALLAVGAGLSFAHLKRAGGPVAVSAVLKLLGLPLLVWAGCALAGLDAVTTTVAVLYAGLPCSASSYVLARRMGGDAPLVAGIITAQTLASVVTITLLAGWVGAGG
ncbi:AEC family transporter [Roseospira navarrensis]|uniref:AEC family transporter n=1 Tax=Roseospira navarrensis TaxID=140058 RepID=A0A7X2D3R0_9PROT|nr:AEC family transporter [Roseospira navarrensis]MQX37088.1 AEC family transporter [Roseospira navarrensis]